MTQTSPSVNNWYITTFYFFKPLTSEEVQNVRKEILEVGQRMDIEGLFILAEEGLNSTCAAASEETLNAFKKWILSRFEVEGVTFKDSRAPYPPFRKIKVKVRDEIVTLGRPKLMPQDRRHHHLTPDEWNYVLKNEQDFVLIDTRNWYEYEIGTFRGALNPNIGEFTSFPDYVESLKIPKEKKMLIFCTGGIRCEKGILDLEERGFSNVYQLEGGILRYLQEKPNDEFEGECFVFDHRVAVTQELTPSERYELCPHCGQPGDLEIVCGRCDTEAKLCHRCKEKPIVSEVCSKNCAHWWELSPGKKGGRQIPVWERKGHSMLAPSEEPRSGYPVKTQSESPSGAGSLSQKT